MLHDEVEHLRHCCIELFAGVERLEKCVTCVEGYECCDVSMVGMRRGLNRSHCVPRYFMSSLRRAFVVCVVRLR